MKRKLFWTAVFFSAGVGAATFNIDAYVAMSALVSFLALSLAFYLMNRRKLAQVFLALAIIAVGTLYFDLRAENYHHISESLHNQKVDIVGRVVGVVYNDYGSARVDLETMYISGDTSKRRLRVTVRNIGRNTEAFRYGDVISCYTNLSKPAAPANIGDGDYGTYLMSKGIAILGNVDYSNVKFQGQDINITRPGDFAYLVRRWVLNTVSRFIQGDAGSFLNGLLIGDLTGMSDEAYSAFRICGLSHITAVSGMHLSIIIMMAMRLFGLFKMKMRPVSVVFYIVLVWIFVLVAGSAASIVRAALMTTLFLAGWFVNREPDGLNSLGFAVMVMLLLNPAALYDVGLRLSALSTISILIFGKPIEERLKVFPKTIREILAITLAAYVGTVPVVAFHFGTVSVIGILANLIITPFVTLLTAMGIIMLALSWVPFLSVAVGFILELLLKGVILIAKILSYVPFGTAYVGRPSLWDFVIYSLFAAALYYLLTRQIKRTTAFAAPALILLVLVMSINLASSGMQITFINVGNGDCALIKTPGHTIMIDSGGNEGFDVAGKTVVPFLQLQGIRQIDVALITHYHYDHCGAYLALLEGGYIKTLFFPEGIMNTELREKLEGTARDLGVQTAYINDMEILQSGDLAILALNAADKIDENNGMAYLLTYGKKRVLFSGDITKEGEDILMNKGIDLSCEILKVPHHGSTTSSSNKFLEATRPQAAVFTTGQNLYGHPAPEVLKRYETRGVGIFRSDLNGTIIFNLTKENILDIKPQRSVEYGLQ